MKPGVGARAMARFDAVPLHRWMGLAMAVVLAVAVFWGGAIGRIDESGRAAEVACRTELAPATAGDVAPEVNTEVVLHWDAGDDRSPADRLAARDACADSGDVWVGPHETLIGALSFFGTFDGRALAVFYIGAVAVAVARVVRRLPAPTWVGALTGAAIIVLVADGSITSAFTSLDPAPMALLGLLVAAGAALPRASLWALLAGVILVGTSIGAPWRIDVPLDGDMFDRYVTATEDLVAPRDVGDGVLPVDSDGIGSPSTCRVCVVSNLGEHARDLAPFLVPAVWALLARCSLQLVRRARRAGDTAAAAVGRLVVLLVWSAVALFVPVVLDPNARAGGELVTAITGVAAALAIPMSHHMVALGRRLDLRPGVVRRLAARAARWLVVPVSTPAPAPPLPVVITLPAAGTVPAVGFAPVLRPTIPFLPARPAFATLVAGPRTSAQPCLRRHHPVRRHRQSVCTGPALARRSGQRGREPPHGGRGPPRGPVSGASRNSFRWALRDHHASAGQARAPPAGARRTATDQPPLRGPPRGRSGNRPPTGPGQPRGATRPESEETCSTQSSPSFSVRAPRR